MGYTDNLKAHTVRIGGQDGGSGVLIKPLDTTVLYILTACHCLDGTTEDTIELSFAEPYYDGIDISVKKIYRDLQTDAAIIVVERFDENVRFIGFKNKPDNPNINCYHTGFPSCRKDENKKRKFAARIISSILDDKSDGNLVEYNYTPVPQKHELTGLSGGGVFNDKYQLLGIHKQSACQDEDEQLGAALYIPCNCFATLIEKNNLSPICEFDLSSFRFIKDDIFKFDNLAAMKDLGALLGAMSEMRPELLKVSPKKIFEELQEKRKSIEKEQYICLQKEDWTRFGEFLLTIRIIKNNEILDYDANQIGKYFHYIFSEEDFDIFEVRKKLNVKLLGKLINKDCVYVIGGIKSKTANYDVKIRDRVPELTVATIREGFDIADAGNTFMCNLTFVNSNLFRDVMENHAPELNSQDGKEIEKYRSLLTKKIYG